MKQLWSCHLLEMNRIYWKEFWTPLTLMVTSAVCAARWWKEANSSEYQRVQSVTQCCAIVANTALRRKIRINSLGTVYLQKRAIMAVVEPAVDKNSPSKLLDKSYSSLSISTFKTQHHNNMLKKLENGTIKQVLMTLVSMHIDPKGKFFISRPNHIHLSRVCDKPKYLKYPLVFTR